MIDSQGDSGRNSRDPNGLSPDAAALLALDPHSVAECRFEHGQWMLRIAPGKIRWACEVLKAHRGHLFLSDITAVDWHPDPRFDVVYQLLCHARKERLQLACYVSSDAPEVESVASIWPAAAVYERELRDSFGIRFRGQAGFRRSRGRDDCEGHPLRKYRTPAVRSIKEST